MLIIILFLQIFMLQLSEYFALFIPVVINAMRIFEYARNGRHLYA